jgi:alpha-L-rhamnosidase
MTFPNLRELRIVCALALFLAILSFSRPFLYADPHGLTQVAGSMEPQYLRVASSINPIGIDRPAPSMSWELRARVPGMHDLRQTSYQILVASSVDELAKNQGNLWDSGRVQSSQRLYVTYGGRPLTSYQNCYWKVRVWDQAGKASGWSAQAQWTMAVLHPEEWKAHWIAAEPDGPLQPQAREHHGQWTDSAQPLPVFRREFRVNGAVKSAIVVVSGLGQYELHMNGDNVTGTLLNPGWTNYRKTVLYNTFDVTRRLQSGMNAFGVLLGNGMYNVPGIHGRYTKFVGSFGQPKLILQMHIEYGDGTESILTSDSSWRTASGPITFSSIYGGEDFDARRQQNGWDRPNFVTDAGWRPALEVEGPDGSSDPPGQLLAGHLIPPITIAEKLAPLRVTQPRPGVIVYDMGKNSAGWPEILVRGRAGDRVRMLPGELLNPDRTVTQASAGASLDNPVLFDYTLAGGEERWHPRFTYYGFRYIQVETIPATAGGPKPRVLSLQTDVVHDDVAVDGHFTSGVPLLNQIHALIDRAILSNLASVISDCPTREKLGWLEQTYLAGSSIMNNYGVLKLYEKVADDMAEAQLASGFVPAIAPEYVAFVDANGNSTNFRDTPEWGSASILSPWEAYRFYGDKEILKDHYDSMVRYAAYLRSNLSDGMLTYGLGDWFDIGLGQPGESQLTGKGLTATAIYYQDLRTLSAIASLLGKDADAASFDSEAAAVRESFNSRLLHADTGTYDRGSQTAQAMPLVLGLVPEDLRQAVLENLIRDIRAHNNHVTAGDIGFHYVVRALIDNGRSDVLFDMLSRDDSPSYGYQLARGATTLTEAWDANPGASQNHFMLGHAEEWFYRGLAGIDVDLSRPESRQFVIRPAFLANVPGAQAQVHTVLGTVESSWAREGMKVVWRVHIPVGSRAVVTLPQVAAEVSMNGGPPPPASPVGEVSLGSGAYEFRFQLR